MRIKSVNKHIRRIIVFLFGVEFSNPMKITIECVDDETLRELLCEDEFGLYKKENAKIPHRYKKIYRTYKRCREELIYAKYYKLNIFVKYGFRKHYYLCDAVEKLSESDRIVVKELLSKG